ncbi:hypothetical protein ACFX1T_013263 [Malus domestica]
MESSNNMESFGGFHWGHNGANPADPISYEMSLNQDAASSLCDEILEIGMPRRFYTPEMQMQVTLHRLQGPFEISRRRLAFGQNKEYLIL